MPCGHEESCNEPRPRQNQRRSGRSAPGPEGVPAAEPLRCPGSGGEPPDDKAGLRQPALRRLVAHPGRPDQSEAFLLRGRQQQPDPGIYRLGRDLEGKRRGLGRRPWCIDLRGQPGRRLRGLQRVGSEHGQGEPRPARRGAQGHRRQGHGLFQAFLQGRQRPAGATRRQRLRRTTPQAAGRRRVPSSEKPMYG